MGSVTRSALGIHKRDGRWEGWQRVRGEQPWPSEAAGRAEARRERVHLLPHARAHLDLQIEQEHAHGRRPKAAHMQRDLRQTNEIESLHQPWALQVAHASCTW